MSPLVNLKHTERMCNMKLYQLQLENADEYTLPCQEMTTEETDYVSNLIDKITIKLQEGV